MTHFDFNPNKHTHPHSQKYQGWEDAYRKGQEDCATTHFKPDWEVNAKMLKEAVDETREDTVKEERQAVAGWLGMRCYDPTHEQHHWNVLACARNECGTCMRELYYALRQGHAPTESGGWE